MKAARFSVQFESNYHQNRGKHLKKGSFQTSVCSALHESMFYTKAEAVSLVSLLVFFLQHVLINLFLSRDATFVYFRSVCEFGKSVY
jgi:hypothetical protein